VDAEERLLFKAVLVRSILFGQVLKLEGVGRMGEQQLEDHLADPVHLSERVRTIRFFSTG